MLQSPGRGADSRERTSSRLDYFEQLKPSSVTILQTGRGFTLPKTHLVSTHFVLGWPYDRGLRDRGGRLPTLDEAFILKEGSNLADVVDKIDYQLGSRGVPENGWMTKNRRFAIRS